MTKEFTEGVITMDDKIDHILSSCLKETGKNPIKLFNKIARAEHIAIHGPEHHILDGAAILTAFYNAGGNVDLEAALKELARRGLKMPGATCGMWGVCGAVNSTGAALSIIAGTGPLSEDDSWGNHMKFTANTLNLLAATGGPRCCKRGAYISMLEAVKFIKYTYDVEMELTDVICGFSSENQQCIKIKCPFYR